MRGKRLSGIQPPGGFGPPWLESGSAGPDGEAVSDGAARAETPASPLQRSQSRRESPGVFSSRERGVIDASNQFSGAASAAAVKDRRLTTGNLRRIQLIE
jgi:hypothetical protein